MNRYTVDLGKAKSFSRKRRAQKAMAILREKLEKREGESVAVAPEVNKKIWEQGAENPPTRLEVQVEEINDTLTAKLPEQTGEEEVEPEPDPEPETEEETEDETEETEEYDEILSGTVGEAKEAINDLEDPDYEAILEAEESGKDRKTLKEFLESKIE